MVWGNKAGVLDTNTSQKLSNYCWGKKYKENFTYQQILFRLRPTMFHTDPGQLVTTNEILWFNARSGLKKESCRWLRLWGGEIVTVLATYDGTSTVLRKVRFSPNSSTWKIVSMKNNSEKRMLKIGAQLPQKKNPTCIFAWKKCGKD